MNIRHKALAILLGAVMFALAPLGVSAATNSPAARSTKLAPAAVAAAYAGGVTVPVSGTTSKGGKFTGNFAVSRFQVVDNQIVAVGTLTGTIQNSVGNVIGTVLKTIQMIVAIKAASCDILHLELGPLDLNLLGLEVHLNRIVLDIDADPTGGLLGALLCAVANLLDAGGPLADIVGLLNQILALL
ncbi:MAG TPA: hypothetical protein VF591_11560 [Pyrinomonadaceae bacterium]|jgi:hypothetical protein